MSVFDDLSLTALDDSPFDPSQLEGKAVLVVNVASKCGFTPQYEGLQALWETYREQGLVVVGVPCNQFGGQEPGEPDEIQTFCKANYGVDFPLLQKQDVNGGDRSELYERLVSSEVGGGKRIKWNFSKFVVDRGGKVVARFGSRAKPQSDKVTTAIEAALGE